MSEDMRAEDVRAEDMQAEDMRAETLPRYPLVDDGARRELTHELDATYFVEAGAGAGKSTAMVARVVALVDRGEDIRTIAAITFTEKAALELRLKIRAALSEPVRDVQAGPELRERRDAALADLDSAPIGTIHGFCTTILRTLPIEAGVPPRIDPQDAAQGRLETLGHWRARRHLVLDGDEENQREAVGGAVAALAALGMSPQVLTDIVLALDESWDRTERWLATAPSAGDPAPAVDRFERQVAELARTDVTATTATAAKASAAVHELDARLAGIGRLGVDEQLTTILDLPQVKPGNAKVWGTVAETKEAAAALAEARQKACTALADALLIPVAVAIGQLALEGVRARTRSGRLHFHDLLTLTRDLLTGEHRETAHARLHAQFRWILVDEFQDTDPLQAEILFRIAAQHPSADPDWRGLPLRPGHLFMVGDPQQSIYRFRGADISTYLGIREAIVGSMGTALEGGGSPDGGSQGRAATLSTNFRSDPDILNWTNAVFGALMIEESAPASAEGAAVRIQPGHQGLDVRPLAPRERVTAAPRAEDDRGGTGIARQPSTGRLAALSDHPAAAALTGPAVMAADADAASIAQAVAGLLGPEGPRIRPDLTREARPLRPQDVAILLRSRTILAELEDELDALGIEYRAEASSLIYDTAEVRELLVILRALANPADTGSLVLALRSSMLGCGDDDLADWRHRGGTWSIFAPPPASLGAGDSDPRGDDGGVGGGDPRSNVGGGAAGGGPGEGSDDSEDIGAHPVARALAELRELADAAPVVAPAALLETLIERHLLTTTVLDSPRHRDVTRRLVHVVDQARAWWEAEHGSLRDYLAWVDMQEENGADAEKVLDELDSSAVRILTMHAAKGLEFPAVVLHVPKSGRPDAPAVLWDGSIPRFRALQEVVTSGYTEAHDRERQADGAEALRLLYVACTRAQHVLVLPRHADLQPAKPESPRFQAQRLLCLVNGTDAIEGIDVLPAPVPPAPVITAEAPWAPPGAPDGQDAWERARRRWQAASRIPATTTVTALAHAPHGEDALADQTEAVRAEAQPAPAREEALGSPALPDLSADDLAAPGFEEEETDADAPELLGHGARFGTALHLLLELTRLDPAADLEALAGIAVAAQTEPGAGADADVDGQLDQERLVAMARWALATDALIEAQATGRFWFELDMAARLDDGEGARGEERDERDGSEAPLLVGRADLAYLDEAGRLTVVDFKSDRSPSARLIAEYGAQVRMYRDVMARVTGSEPGRALLLFAAPEMRQVIEV